MAKKLVLSLLAVWVLHVSHNWKVDVFIPHGLLDEQVVLVVSVSVHEGEHALDDLLSLLLGEWGKDVHSKYLVDEVFNDSVHLHLRDTASSLLFVEVWNLFTVQFVEKWLVVWFVKTTHVTETRAVVEEIKLLCWFLPLVCFYLTFFLFDPLLAQ